MKAKQIKWFGVLLAAMACASIGVRAEPTLKVGDPAPKLVSGKWIQGEPVKEFEKGKAYLVEFWATWCGPCKVSIPHLNEIHSKYKDKGLVVIGQDCWERDDKLVAPFVKKMDDKMTYRVALDDKASEEKGKMAKTWMEAAGRNGIPSAFLVDTKGVIAWIGHPMQLKDSVIEEVLAGTFDIKKAAQAYDDSQKNEEKFARANGELRTAMASKDWEQASAKLAEAERLLPEDERAGMAMLHFQILTAQDNYPAAYKWAKEFSDNHKEDAQMQNELAWEIATGKDLKQRDLPLAQTIAERASAAAKDKDPLILDTVARVLFMRGKKDEAIALQQKAVGLAAGDTKTQLEKTLESYKKGEPSS